MSLDKKKVNEELIRFWDEAFSGSEEDDSPLPDYLDLAPSRKLADAVARLGKRNHVLDYGCGSAWASIIAAKSGCINIDAVDLGESIIASAKTSAKA